MRANAFLPYIKSLPEYQGQIVHIESLPPKKPNYGELCSPLPPPLETRLKERGLYPLYSYQARAIDLVRNGENVIVLAPAASGKSLCYNIPVLESLLKESKSCFLYLFPTKALAQDQWKALRENFHGFLNQDDVGIFDGDTPSTERARIKRKARLLITNPDMLHLGILPNHTSWARLLSGLKFVVVDEAHTYHGVFGSQVAQVFRRLRRILNLYGSTPQFILCSATLGNPEDFALALTGVHCHVIPGEGSPQPGRDFVFWNPPYIGSGVRKSPNSEAAFLLSELVGQGIRTLAFARTRKLAELLNIYTRERLGQKSSHLADKVKSYRAGYLPQLRRQIEQELFSGKLLAVTATNALELGIDIGELEATILVGYPGSIASTWQQATRSGRRGKHALSFLIAYDSPLDQYLVRHPEAFFGRAAENALINPQNPYLLKPHLLCAAWEYPLDENELSRIEISAIQELAFLGFVKKRNGRYFPSPSISYPAEQVNLRTISEKPFTIIDISTGSLLETVEGSVAFLQIHPGAIYLHQGESYLITDLDLASRTAYVRQVEVDYYTEARELIDIKVLNIKREKSVRGVRVYFGQVEVKREVVGFRKKRQFTEEVIGEEALDLPPYIFPTTALWFSFPLEVGEKILRDLDLAGGLHALEHASIALLPLFALCSRNDIGGLSTPYFPDTGMAQIFIYDNYPGGVGIAEKGYEVIEELWGATLKLISGCPCKEGCPCCIYSPKCGNNNQPMDKKTAVLLCRYLVGDLKYLWLGGLGDRSS